MTVLQDPNSATCMTLIARAIVIASLAIAVVGIVLYSIDLHRHGWKEHLIGWYSSAGFVLLTFPISIRLIFLHLTHWYNPRVQKYVVRIIWMVPLYSVESWLALRFHRVALYIETFRECYEAYVIFSFLYFLIALLGEEVQLITALKQKPVERGRHPWPISLCTRPWVMGPEFLHRCKYGVLQYVVFKNLMAVITISLQLSGKYNEGSFRFNRGYLYVCSISNISQLWALYCLIKFYIAAKEELSPWRPIGKFMSVKMVVFFTWWQSIFISFIASTTPFLNYTYWTREQVVKGLQDYLICIEMFVASIAFTMAFTHRDYFPKDKDHDKAEEAGPFLSAFLQSSYPDDMLSDLRRFAKGQELTAARNMSARKYDGGRLAYGSDPRSPPDTDDELIVGPGGGSGIRSSLGGSSGNLKGLVLLKGSGGGHGHGPCSPGDLDRLIDGMEGQELAFYEGEIADGDGEGESHDASSLTMDITSLAVLEDDDGQMNTHAATAVILERDSSANTLAGHDEYGYEKNRK